MWVDNRSCLVLGCNVSLTLMTDEKFLFRSVLIQLVVGEHGAIENAYCRHHDGDAGHESTLSAVQSTDSQPTARECDVRVLEGLRSQVSEQLCVSLG